MFITPISSSIVPLKAMESLIGSEKNVVQEENNINAPTFLDVFTGIFNSAVETGEQKTQDMIDLMLGNVDSLEQIQTNIAKAETANDLLVTVKNTVVDSYNEIIRMSI